MTTAREEAERRYFGPLGFVSADMVSEESASQREMLAFVAGVEYQSGQPVEITDQMVERGVFALMHSGSSWAPTSVRAVLEAALGGEA